MRLSVEDEPDSRTSAFSWPETGFAEMAGEDQSRLALDNAGKRGSTCDLSLRMELRCVTEVCPGSTPVVWQTGVAYHAQTDGDLLDQAECVSR
jgi:hypothetical protein